VSCSSRIRLSAFSKSSVMTSSAPQTSTIRKPLESTTSIRRVPRKLALGRYTPRGIGGLYGSKDSRFIRYLYGRLN
jgi:hypothetical protein